jgi:hypothetical protein
MPAPIQISYPEDGSDPIVSDFGSFWRVRLPPS